MAEGRVVGPERTAMERITEMMERMWNREREPRHHQQPLKAPRFDGTGPAQSPPTAAIESTAGAGAATS